MKRFLWFALILLWLTACTPTTETAVPPTPFTNTAVPPTQTAPPPVITVETPRVESATAVPDPTQPAAETPVVEAQPTATEVVETSGVISGRTDEGAFFLGDPNAPITHIDYSDFL